MAFSIQHTSAKPQQSPLVHTTPIQNQTHSRVTIIPQKCYRDMGMTQPPPNRSPNPTLIAK